MKTGVFVLILIVFPLLLAAQSVVLVPNVSNIYDEDRLQISTRKVDCIDEANGTAKQYVMLTVWNQNEMPVNISFKKEVWFDDVCSNCTSESPEHIATMKLGAGAARTGTCGTENRSLRIFSKMLELKGVRKLTHYELKNLEIEVLDE